MAFLDPVNTITQKEILPGVTDLVFKSGPTMAYIKRNCLEKYQGGPSWRTSQPHPLNHSPDQKIH